MSSNVCQDQMTFNNAVSTALETYADERKVSSATMTIYFILMLIFFIWALVLAFGMKRGNERLLHIILAMILSPIYVISYYLNNCC